MVFQFVSRFFQFVFRFFTSQPQTSSPEGPPINPVAYAELGSGLLDNPTSTRSAQPSSSCPNATPDSPSNDLTPREPTKLGHNCQPGETNIGDVLESVEHAIEHELREIWIEAPDSLPDLERIFNLVKGLQVVKITKRPVDEFYVHRCINHFWLQMRETVHKTRTCSDGTTRRPPSAEGSNDATSFIEESPIARGILPWPFKIGIMDSHGHRHPIDARTRKGTTSYIARQLVKSLDLPYLPDSISNVTARLFLSDGPATTRCTLHIRDDISGILLGNERSKLSLPGHDHDSIRSAGNDASSFQTTTHRHSLTASHGSSAEDRNKEVFLRALDVVETVVTSSARSKRSPSAKTSDSQRTSSETGPRMG